MQQQLEGGERREWKEIRENEGGREKREERRERKENRIENDDTHPDDDGEMEREEGRGCSRGKRWNELMGEGIVRQG